ncbi:LysR substrate-binding domain-containing protein [Candidatus Persebacteraceae bacterium Df01]|jgi:LysR family cys regulon transcriptional activator|uniref:LysR substrate-binding domain-containing protein n=1 Tax=Candidatus Doriopsillibacter californiensis TaxID=2970740 RepID=A0ABT7QLK6_9GAMM|nr:LysR substrate-binding domain-containing protein [Candidatus Persebacteraceae bacterium Df01]
MNIKFSTLRCLVAVCDNKLNVTEAARELNTMQPLVSKKLIELEEEMENPLFVRNGKRFVSTTKLCDALLVEAREILLKCDNIKALSDSHHNDTIRGDMRIGTTHTQARYILPAVLRQFRQEYADSRIEILQGTPINLVHMLENNQVDMVICTEAMEENSALFSVTAYAWNRSVVMLKTHPLVQEQKMTLKCLTAWPIVTYVHGFTGRRVFDATFHKAGLIPNVVVSAVDSDIIKTYVREGIGVGIVANVCYHEKTDHDLTCFPVSHIFPDMQVRIAYHREKIITHAMQRFMVIFQEQATFLAPQLGAYKPLCTANIE